MFILLIPGIILEVDCPRLKSVGSKLLLDAHCGSTFISNILFRKRRELLCFCKMNAIHWVVCLKSCCIRAIKQILPVELHSVMCGRGEGLWEAAWRWRSALPAMRPGKHPFPDFFRSQPGTGHSATDSRFSCGSTFEPRSHIPSATTWS